MTALVLSDLTVFRTGRRVVDHISCSIEPGECVGLIGPNGAGKTSLLRAALALLPAQGHSNLAAEPPAKRARLASWLPQQRHIAWPVTVENVIALGRLPHLPRGARLSPIDQAAVDRAIDRMGLAGYRSRVATQLSGGEQARVLIARALAQETPILLADEPIAGLDPANQIASMEVFADLAREGRTIVVSLHDLGLAARHCSRLLMLDAGRLVADGPPAKVLTDTNLAEVFGIRAHFMEGPDGPVFQPMGLT